MQIIPVSCGGVHDDFHIGWSAHQLAFRFFQPNVSMPLQQFQRWKNLLRFLKATPHKCNDTHCRIAILWKAIGLPRTFARKSALTQAARQGLSARIRFANANMMLNLAPCFSSPRYRVFRKRSCFLTTPNTCSTFARTEDFACSAFFAAY